MKKNTRTILIGVAILLTVILLVWLFKPSANKNEAGLVSTSTASGGVVASSTPLTTPITATTKTTVKATTLNYTELVKKYAGYRFQFSNNCAQSTPTSFVIKAGSKFLIDNREDKAHTFTFSNQKYFVKAYSYALVTAQTLGKQSVFCDGIQRAVVNVAK